ncbi:MAG: AI-2E family transporter [Lachnospiraceae bacterium]|nr:AI-2E family transporter [Lachnospiraceae bacterium]
MNKPNFEWTKWIPITIIAIVLMITYKTFDNISQITSGIARFLGIVSPLLYGILFAYFLFIPFKKVKAYFGRSKWKFIAKRKKLFSIFVIFLLLVTIIVFIVLVIAPILIASIMDLINSIPFYVRSIMDYIQLLDDEPVITALNISESLTEMVEGITSQFLNRTLMEQLTRGVFSLAGGLFNIVLGIFICLYILTDLENIAAFFNRLSIAVIKNEKLRGRLHQYLKQVNKVILTFLASKGLDSIINMIAVTVILRILNVPYPILFGFIAGVFNFIPYLGSLIAMTFISMINIITAGPAKAIQVLIILLIFQQLDANYIEPKIMNTSLKISPILVIVSVIAGGAYFGIVGMFLAVPLVTIVKQILIEYMDHHVKE